MTDVSIILPVRDQENAVAPLVRCGMTIADTVEPPRQDAERSPLAFELLALDERSGDNTLSILSVLHGQIPNLRTLQDVEIGAALRRAARVARGHTWLIMDRPIDPPLGRWAVEAVMRGKPAAIVPGELLAVERDVGLAALARLRGGLVSAQAAVSRHLKSQGTTPAFSPASDTTPVAKAKRLLRSSLGRVGLGRFDRP